MFKFAEKLRGSVPAGIVLLITLGALLAACGGAPAPAPTYTPYPTYTPFPTLAPPAANTPLPPSSGEDDAQCSGTPVISSFTANPTTIQVGETATLQWGLVANAHAAVLVSPDGRLGVETPGSTLVQPDQTTTYSMYGLCGNTTVQQQVTVNVEVPGGCSGVPEITSFTANPSTIQPGQTTTLQWGTVTNASAAVLLGPEGKKGVATPGEVVIEPNQTTTYALVAFCDRDAVQKNVTVTVEGTETCTGAPVISTFTAEPDTIQKGESTTLQWGLVANASGAYLTDGEVIIGVATPGQEVVKPDQTTSYALVAFCGSYIVQSDLTVTVE
jgi:hypothetical protein